MRERRKRNGTRDGRVIKAGWQASTAAAARFSDHEGFCTGQYDFMPSAASRPRLRTGAREGPPFWLYPIAQLCARHGVLAVAAVMEDSAAPTPRSAEATAAPASEPLALLRSEGNPAVAHTLLAWARSPPAISSPAYRRLGLCLNARDRDLCHFAASATITAMEVRICRRWKRGPLWMVKASTGRREIAIAHVKSWIQIAHTIMVGCDVFGVRKQTGVRRGCWCGLVPRFQFQLQPDPLAIACHVPPCEPAHPSQRRPG